MKKFTLAGAALLFLTSHVGVTAQEGCTDAHCYRPQPYYMHPSHRCCPPNQPPLDSEPDRPSGGYVAPPPTGETVGGSNSVGLRLGSLRIPEINIPLPTLKLPSLVHYKRAPEVYLDRAIAAYQPNAQIMDFGQIPSADSQPDRPSQQADRPHPQPQCCPPTQPPGGCVPPGSYCPPPRRPEGCVDGMQIDADPWRSSGSYELAQKEQQVERLHSQVDQLRELVRKLAEQQNTKVVVPETKAPVRPAGFRRPSAVPSEASLTESSPSVTEKMAAMQRQLDALQAAQRPSQSPPSETAVDGQRTDSTTSEKRSVLGRIGKFFRRG